ncbi:MAG: Co/Zn/Cd efflux system rane fusion protein, partial [Chitinophagaceae bacterium]|nr:Co/Zn/Cd efflux system rane fusion protein [Chitinophagaceae bacterium]
MKQSLIILYFFIILIGCIDKPGAEIKTENKGSGNMVELTEAQLKNAGIAIGKPEQRVMSSILKVNGIIDVPPQNTVSVSVPLGGYLKSTKLLPGMH